MLRLTLLLLTIALPLDASAQTRSDMAKLAMHAAYVSYADVNLCYFARIGQTPGGGARQYTPVYISDEEVAKAQAAIKQIEAVLAPRIDGSVEQIWAAVLGNFRYKRFGADRPWSYEQQWRDICQEKLTVLMDWLVKLTR